ncbi:MAG: alginate O-acetyltransferase AlgF [Pseudomonadota bacterium]
MKTLILSSLLCLFISVQPSFAEGDDGLYDPVAPKGTAFVRFFNTTDKETSFSVHGKKYDNVDGMELSPYYVQKNGDVDVAVGAGKVGQKLEEGHFYTAFVTDGTVKVLDDQSLQSRAKALVVFYNLTKQDKLALKTADGKVEVIAPQEKNTAAGREMNGVKVSFAAFAADKSKAVLPDIVLERGKAYAVIASEGKDGSVTLKRFDAITNTKK